MWINSNMPDLPLPGQEERQKVVEYMIKSVGDKKVEMPGAAEKVRAGGERA